MRDRGEVDDRADAVDERAAIELGGDIGDEDLMQLGRNGARRDEAPYRGADRVSARDQLATKGGADEARRTGDENAHVRTAGRGAPPPFGATPDSSKPYLQGAGATTIRALSKRRAARVTIPFYPVILSGGSGTR